MSVKSNILSIFVSLVAMAHPLSAVEFHLLDLDYAAIEYEELKNYRDPYMPEYSIADFHGRNGDDKEHWRFGTALNFDVAILQIDKTKLYWDNRVHMDATTNQPRHVGWQFELGLAPCRRINFFYEHHSQHVMDKYELVRFPVRDGYGVRFILLDVR